MNEISARLVEPGQAPTPAQVEGWLGKKAYAFWTRTSD